MKLKPQALVIFLFLFSLPAFAENNSTAQPISIETVNGHQEAIVTTPEVVKQKPTGFINKSFYYFEQGIVIPARAVSAAAGKITDTTVVGTKQVATPVFSPLIKAMDVRYWYSHKQKR